MHGFRKGNTGLHGVGQCLCRVIQKRYSISDIDAGFIRVLLKNIK